MGLLYRARPTSRADNTRDGRAGHTNQRRSTEAFPKPNFLVPGLGVPLARPSVARSLAPRPRKNTLPPILTTPVPTFPATHVRGPAATHGALSGEGRVVGACNLPSSAVHYILARVRSPFTLGGLMRTGGASWLMPFLVLSLYSIANDSVLFSAVPHA